jgi:hypothetical protein
LEENGNGLINGLRTFITRDFECQGKPFMIHEPLDEGVEIDIKIIGDPHRGLIDPDLSS